MGLIEEALARQERVVPRAIDYDRMNRVHPKQKAALTRAIKTGDPEVIARVCKAAVIEWNAIGAWPDDWARWQVALNDSLHWSQTILLENL